MRSLTAEHRVLLALARDASGALEERDLRGIDGDRLASLAVQNNLAALVHHRLTSGPPIPGAHVLAPGSAAVERLRRDRWFCLAHTHALHTAFEEILPELWSRGIEVLPLKGLLFSRALYPSVDLRPMVDVDLLARPADLGAIGGIFEHAGYVRSGPATRPATQAAMFETRWARRAGPFLVLFEVHHALGQETRYRVDTEGLWLRAVPASRYGVDAWGSRHRALSPEDNLLHICLHQSNHMFDELDLRSTLDLDAVITRWRPDWSVVVPRARAWGVATALHIALRSARALLGTEIPDDVIAGTRPGPLRRAWLEAFIDADGLGAYRFEGHPGWLVRALVGFPLMDRLSDRMRFARSYAGLRMRDLLASGRR